MCVYVCVYVCMYVHVCVRNVYVCMYVCMYVYAKVNFHFVKAQSKLACIAQSELARIAKVNYFFFLFTFCFFFSLYSSYNPYSMRLNPTVSGFSLLCMLMQFSNENTILPISNKQILSLISLFFSTTSM